MYSCYYDHLLPTYQHFNTSPKISESQPMQKNNYYFENKKDYASVETGVADGAKDYALWFFLDNASQDAFAAKRKHPNCIQF